MFFRKHYLTDPAYGKFEWMSDHWLSLEPVNGLSLSIEGTKTEFNSTSLIQAKELFESKETILSDAITYLSKENIGHFSSIEALKFSCLTSRSVLGNFDVEFEVKEWEDAYVIVHFKNYKPVSLSLGD